MPDLLREQFPHFRPIVEAFGYRNLEFEGWEADDVIATLATRADEAGIRTCVVSTDRDAFQLCSENVCLMMTPRGVSDVNVYTPERVEARYGVRPDQVPDFIGLKGDTSDNIPGVPGIGDKTAGQLIAQYGSLEEVLEHVDELSPGRSKSIREHADQARASKELATMRRDLPLDVDPAELVSAPPDRSELKEIFRRFEFRALLGRVDELDEAVPAAEQPRLDGEDVPWVEGDLGRPKGAVAVAFDGERAAVASGAARPVVGRRSPPASELAAALRDARRRGARREGAPARPRPGRRHAARRLPRRSRPLRVPARRPRARVRARARARAGGGGGDSVARAPRRGGAAPGAAPARARPRARLRAALRRDRAPAHGGARGDGGRGREDRHVPHGGDHGAPRRPRRGARGARVRARRARSSSSAPPSSSRASSSTSSGSRPAARARRATRPTLACCARSAADHAIVPVIEEWRELTKLLNTYLGPLPSLISPLDGRLHTTFNQAVAATGRLSTSNPNLQAIPGALGPRPRDPLGVRRGGRLPPALRRLQPGRAADPRARLRRARAQGGVRARRGHPRRHRRRGARQGACDADEGRARRGEDGQLRDHLRHLRVRPLGEPRDPEGRSADVHRHVPRPLPARAGVHRAHGRAGRPQTGT